jgi:hypothetical protein
MKKLALCITFVVAFTLVQAQNQPNYQTIKLETKEDFNEAANTAALQAANYLFSTAINTNIDRLDALQFVIKWMTGTPTYSFTLDNAATKFAKNDYNLLGLYMAAMVKYVLENKEQANNQNNIKLNALQLVINYAKNTSNNVPLNKEFKKAIKAADDGSLKDYLGIK